MIYAATGHRPPKLGGYSEAAHDRLRHLALAFIDRTPEIREGISGMALGWDQAWAWALTERKIPWIAAIPFYSQSSTWPRGSRLYYQHLLSFAREKKIVCAGGYAPWKMQKRNQWMVDHCDKLVALYDGSREGGTFRCLLYADRTDVDVEVINIWDDFQKLAA